MNKTLTLICITSYFLATHLTQAQELYFPPVHLDFYQGDSTLDIDTNYYHDQYLWAAYNDYPSLFIHFEHRGKTFEFTSPELEEVDSMFLRDITGDGFPELFIRNHHMGGHSSWNAGGSESWKQLLIYNLWDSLVILNEELSYQFESWYNELEKPLDSLGPDEEPTIIGSVTDYECYEFGYILYTDGLKIYPLENGACPIENTPEDWDAEPFTIRWSAEGFVKE